MRTKNEIEVRLIQKQKEARELLNDYLKETVYERKVAKQKTHMKAMARIAELEWVLKLKND